jgi:hypothetical protein
MKTTLLTILCLVAGVAFSQTITYNTNYLVIAVAGTSSQNGNYIYQPVTISPYSTGCFTNMNGDGATIGTFSGSIIMGDYYHATSFPTTWATDAGSNPAPTGSYLAITNAWYTGLTNYWRLPGDQAFINAAGYNLAVPGATSNTLALAFNGTNVYVTPFCSANGLTWNLSGTWQWDGTNLNCGVQYSSGDTNVQTVSAYFQIGGVNPGTNALGMILSDPVNLVLTSAQIQAQRTPTNDVPVHAYQPTVQSYLASNTWSLFAITNGMPEYSFWTGNSNGRALVSLWLSNGVPWIKQLQP